MNKSEKVHEALKGSIPAISDLMDADYEKVYAAAKKKIDKNKAGTKYTYTIKVELDIRPESQSINTGVDSEWPLEGKGKNHKDGIQVLLDKPLGENKLEGAGEDFGRSLPPKEGEGDTEGEEPEVD